MRQLPNMRKRSHYKISTKNEIDLNFMALQKVQFVPCLSLLQKHESSDFKLLWTPAFAGVTRFLTFYEIIKFNKMVIKFSQQEIGKYIFTVQIIAIYFFAELTQ